MKSPKTPTTNQTPQVIMSHQERQLTKRAQFTAVMDELCMKTVFDYTNIVDRIRFIRVSKRWSHILHQPYIWSNVTWTTPRRSISPVGRGLPPEWLCSIIGGLTLQSSRPEHHSLLPFFQQFHHLCHLSVAWPIDKNKEEESADNLVPSMGIWPRIFREMKLVSFLGNDLSDSILATLFSVTHPRTQPIIINWCSTLKRFHLILTRPFIDWPFTALLLVDSWPLLEDVKFHAGAISLTKEQANEFTSFLSADRLPSLRILFLYCHFYSSSDMQDMELCQLLDARIRELSGLEEMNVRLFGSNEWKMRRQFSSDYTHSHLASVDTLQRLSLMPSPTPLKVNELLFLSQCHALQTLRLSPSCMVQLPTRELLEIINAQHLPHLRHLSFRVFMESSPRPDPSSSTESSTTSSSASSLKHTHTIDARDLRLFEMMAGMKSLETLELWYSGYDPNAKEGDWLKFLHAFPSLTQFVLELDSNQRTLPPDFFLSLANAPQLHQVELLRLDLSHLTDLAQYWYERHQRLQQASSNSSFGGFLGRWWKKIRGRDNDNKKEVESKPIIASANSSLSQSLTAAPAAASFCDSILASTPIRVQTLSLQHLGLEPSKSCLKPHHPMKNILQQLATSLPRLSSLTFRIRIIGTHMIRTIRHVAQITNRPLDMASDQVKDVGQHWKELIHFRNLTSLVLDEELAVTSAVLDVWCRNGSHLQQLERLDLGSDTLLEVKPIDLMNHLLRLPKLHYFTPWDYFSNRNDLVDSSFFIKTAVKPNRPVSLVDGDKENANSIRSLSFLHH